MKKLMALVLCLISIICMFTGCFGPTKSEPEKELAYDEFTSNMKISVVTYSQTAIKDYVKDPSFPWDMDDYNVVRTNDRYKIEGTVNGIRYWCIMNWDYQKDEYFDVVSLQIGDTVLIG